jgi:NADH:ubiquinone oxidoreductase subunit 4 (subunit M)
VLLLPALLILAVGVYPLPILEVIRPTAEAWVAALAGL